MSQKKTTTPRLVLKDVHASIDGKKILNGMSLEIASGQVHAIMGPNGSGKSTLANVLMGHPAYEPQGNVYISTDKSENILEIPSEERAKKGIFLAFQTPIAIPGVSVLNVLRTGFMEIHGGGNNSKPVSHSPGLSVKSGSSMVEFIRLIKETAKSLHIDESFLQRGMHDAFSGGEKKKIEMLQALILKPKFAIFDEIDTGLDVDALQIVARGISQLVESGCGVIVITHYQRILSYTTPDYIHVLVNGKIVKSGTADIAKEIEVHGYKEYQSQ